MAKLTKTIEEMVGGIPFKEKRRYLNQLPSFTQLSPKHAARGDVLYAAGYFNASGINI